MHRLLCAERATNTNGYLLTLLEANCHSHRMLTNRQPDVAPVLSQGGMRPARPPILSIGLPVYNGSAHLRESMISLLEQDIEDLEVVVSDNASTDETSDICMDFARRDPRVSYHRSESNVGAAENFNRVFALCSGEYFMWASDDDVWHPRYASACISKLTHQPSAVLCTSGIQQISEQGTSVGVPRPSLNTVGMSTSQRILSFLERQESHYIYGVMRPDLLRASGGYRATFGGDIHLLLELALLGDFCSVPETLMSTRIQTTAKSGDDYLIEIGVKDDLEVQSAQPWTFLVRTLADVITQSSLDEASRTQVVEGFIHLLSGDTSKGWGEAVLREHGMPALPPWAAELQLRAVFGNRARAHGDQHAAEAWQMKDNMRLTWVRTLLLRILRPFTERQSAKDEQQDALIRLLSDEIERLASRVRAIETTHLQD